MHLSPPNIIHSICTQQVFLPTHNTSKLWAIFLFSLFISVTLRLVFVLKSIFAYFAMEFPNTLVLTVCFRLINFIFRTFPLFVTMYKHFRLCGIVVTDIATIAV